MTTILWTGVGFVLGAVPFSVWLGHLALRTDIRHYGNGNPGAINAWRAGGWRVGLPASLLDYLKGAVPVGLAHLKFGLSGWQLVCVALAPVLGHAFSPFLRLRGGKALAVTFGIWTGLTLGEGPTMLGTLFGFLLLVQTADAWAIVLGMLAFLAYLVWRKADSSLLLIWAGNMLILSLKQRHDLHTAIQLRPWISRLLKGDH